jgi:DNA replication protein DnaC
MMWRSANRILHDRNEIASAWSKPFLVIDDLGKEGDSTTRRADISNVISARYDVKLPTIVTTELAFTDIISTYGKHTAYKLSEDENSDLGGMIINCGNISVRYEDDLETGEDEEHG